MLGLSAPGRLHSRRFAGLLSVVRRPRGVAEAVALVAIRQLEQSLE
jgi:hypothetical protein